MMFINRNWNYSEQDDFQRHITDKFRYDPYTEAIPQYTADGLIVGWKIQNRYE